MQGSNARMLGAFALIVVTMASVFAMASPSDAADPDFDGETELYGYYVTMGLQNPDMVESVEWDFGDGTDRVTVQITADNPTGMVKHTYAGKGDYTVTATMRNTYTDSDGNEKSGESVLTYVYHIKGYPVIRFESRGGTAVEPIDCGAASSVQEPPAAPTNEGLEFAGWYTDAACTNPFDWSKPITYSIVLFAGWTGNAHTVTFDPGNGEDAFSIVVSDGKTVAKPEDPSRSGYAFAGWYLDGKEYDFDTPIAEDVTLKAQWVGGSDILVVLGILFLILAVICFVAFWLSGIILFAVPAVVFLIIGIATLILG